ncbi:hypothetical protein LINGRAHAP2_LOCUS21323 [Linum grandiflorum]
MLADRISTEPLMDRNASFEEAKSLRNGLESANDKPIDRLRPAARHNSVFRGQQPSASDLTGQEKGKYSLIRDPEDFLAGGAFDKPLPCFGCGIGWFSFLSGFLFPLMWYYATILYFGNYYRKDPRERAGLAAAAIAAMGCSVVMVFILAYCFLF